VLARGVSRDSHSIIPEKEQISCATVQESLQYSFPKL
jgi:hypothetical protein